MWNNFIFPLFRADVGVEQEFILSSVLSTLYISPIFYIFEKRAKNLTPNIFITFFFFINNGLFISQKKIYEKSNALLFCSYNIITSLFDQFILMIEHGKYKVFHFSKLARVFNLSPLDLSLLEGLLL